MTEREAMRMRAMIRKEIPNFLNTPEGKAAVRQALGEKPTPAKKAAAKPAAKKAAPKKKQTATSKKAASRKKAVK